MTDHFATMAYEFARIHEQLDKMQAGHREMTEQLKEVERLLLARVEQESARTESSAPSTGQTAPH